MERTAQREVCEETRLLVRLLRAVGRIQYSCALGGARYDKTVDFYLMQAIGGDTADHDDEYDFAQWFSVGDAVRQMAYPNEAHLVEKAIGLLTTEQGLSAAALSAITRPPSSS